jgi:DNA-binding NarL/FixJ family response regulator
VTAVLLADDDAAVRTALRTVLDADPAVRVVGEAADGAEAVELAVRTRPDVVLLDLRMPGVDGLTALPRLRALRPAPAVVALTVLDADAWVLRALDLGAAGFLPKATPPRELVRLVLVAAAGHTVLGPEAGRAVSAALRPPAPAVEGTLTGRERAVLAALGEGLSNGEIGTRLDLRETTVKGYVSSVLAKLGCANRTQAGLVARAVLARGDHLLP